MYWEGVCANFVVQSISKKLFCVNISVSQVFEFKNFLRPGVFLCKKFLSDNKNFLACKTAKMGRDMSRLYTFGNLYNYIWKFIFEN